MGWGLDIVYVSGGRKGMWDAWKEEKEENCEGGREGGIHGIRTTVTEKTILGESD